MKHRQTGFAVTLAAMVCALIAAPAVAAEIYRWTDENGVTHFSQTPPPDGQEAVIENVPDKLPPGSENATSGVDFDGAQAPAGDEMSAADLRRQELAQSRAEMQAEQAALSSACREARARLEQIEPSRRVYYTDEDGETVRMDDEERVAQVEQLRDFLDSNCP